jgi:hypothetical protein
MTAAPSAPPTNGAEIKRLFHSACYVMTATKGLRRGEKAFAGRLVWATMCQEMPSAADVAAIDAACDRVLAGMKSRLADFLLAERAARKALGGGE